jgi:hypothetical protein
MVSPIRPASELAAEIQGKQDDEQLEDENPRARRNYSFNFEYTDDRGKIWKGLFTNQCLSPNQKLQVGVLKGNLLGRMPYESVDAYTRELAERIAHMTISLIKRPPWAKELGDILDENLIHRIYEQEVLAHEGTFHGRESDQAEGEKAAQDGDGQPDGVAGKAESGGGPPVL